MKATWMQLCLALVLLATTLGGAVTTSDDNAVLVGVPQTYPVHPVNGFMVSDLISE